MLLILLVFGIEAAAESLGLMSSPTVLELLALANGFASFWFAPVGLVIWFLGPPLFAQLRGRRWWVWLLGAFALGPFALIVGALPIVIQPKSNTDSGDSEPQNAA